MGKIHKRAHRDLGKIISSTDRLGDRVVLISPSGITDDTVGVVVYTQSEVDENGINIIRYRPRVDLEINNLARVPAPGEKWIVKIPISKLDDTLSIYTVEGKPIMNYTHGIVSLCLKAVVQSVIEE